jgi:hypothetical protein
MRTLFTLLIVLTLSSVTPAQEYKNFVTGTFAVLSQQGDASEVNNFFFQFQPGFGKQLNPGWAVGTNLRFSFSQNTFEQPNIRTGTRNLLWGIDFWARRNLNPDNQLIVFLEPSIFFRSSRSSLLQGNGDWQPSESAQTFAGLGTSVGLSYQLTPRFRFLTRFGGLFLERRFDNNGNNGSTAINFSVGTRNMNFGAEYLW